MIRGPKTLGDPFEGRGAQRTHVRLRIEGVVALTMAVAAFSAAAGPLDRHPGPRRDQPVPLTARRGPTPAA